MWPNKLPSLKHKQNVNMWREKLEFRNYVIPGVLIRYLVGQYVNQQRIYLYSEATTYASGIKFTGDQ
jgi:hypothetical protein